MTLKQLTGLAAAVISLLIVAAQTATAKTHAHEKCNHAHVHFVKPGAAVSLTHDYDGKLPHNGMVNLTVTLNHIYQNGLLSAKVVPSPEMQIVSGTQTVQSYLSEGSELMLYVQLAAPKQGEHFLGVETIYEGLSGNQTRRVFSIPVSENPTSIGKAQSKTVQSKKIKSTKIIGLPAQERIK